MSRSLLRSGARWYSFLEDLSQALSAYEVQRDRGKLLNALPVPTLDNTRQLLAALATQGIQGFDRNVDLDEVRMELS